MPTLILASLIFLLFVVALISIFRKKGACSDCSCSCSIKEAMKESKRNSQD